MVFFMLPGLNFGLASAPLGFNCFPRIAMQHARRGLPLQHSPSTTISARANPFKRGPATRLEVCRACECCFEGGESATSICSHRDGNPLETCARPAAPGTTYARDAEVDALAKLMLGGEPVRLICHCYPRLCHASSVTRIIHKGLAALSSDARRSKEQPQG